MKQSTYCINLSDDSLVYDQFQYPGGEWQVRIKSSELDQLKNSSDVRVTARIRDGNDIMKLALLADAIFPIPATLVLPYLPYARADRCFVPGDCFALSVFADLIATMAFESVVTLDAHSKVSVERLDLLIDVSPQRFIEHAIVNFSQRNHVKRITVLFPDEGARERYKMPASIGYNLDSIKIDVLNCEKKRDPKTGKLSGFSVPNKAAFQSDCALIVDDICDGGGTFLGIAESMKGHDVKLGLYVTHGIFSKGLGELLQKFDRIYTTNSIDKNWLHEEVYVFHCETALAEATMKATSVP